MIEIFGIDIVQVVAGTVLMAVFGLVAGILFLGIDRKFAAHMQARIGPPIRQPLRDVLKLLCKDSIVPENAVAWLFNAAPILALASSIIILLYLPAGSFSPVLGGYGDLILVMYLLTIPALAMVAGGFASGSPYATTGAQREMVTMISYELPLAIAIIAIAWRLSAAGTELPFSILTIANTPIWSVVGPLGIIGCVLLLVVLAWVTPAELSRVPCDTPEAETELCGGLLVEYSGRNLALFQLSLGVKTVALAALTVLLFLPWNLSWYIAMSPEVALAADFVFFLIKVLAIIFFSVSLIRVIMPRFKITHVVSVYWGLFGGIGLLGLLLIVLDVVVGGGVIA